MLLKFGYSKFGSVLIKTVREIQTQRAYDVGYGVKMFLDITNPLTWDLIGERGNEDEVKKTFVKNFKEGDTVIDVGANIGEFSLIAAKKVGTEGKVISIEPLHQPVIWLKKNFILNGFSNYEILEKAVGDKIGTMTLYKKSANSEQGVLDPEITKKELIPCSEIMVDTIDKIMSSRKIDTIDMLKIDVEGYEYEVFCGCKESFKKNKIEKIICEIHSTFLKNRGLDENLIYSLLKENGFSINVIQTTEGRTHILGILKVKKMLS